MPWPREERHGQSMACVRHGHGMASVNQTQPHCVYQMGKTHSKLLAARHGRGMSTACCVLIGLNSTPQPPPAISIKSMLGQLDGANICYPV
jgi:hypothetical protein